MKDKIQQDGPHQLGGTVDVLPTITQRESVLIKCLLGIEEARLKNFIRFFQDRKFKFESDERIIADAKEDIKRVEHLISIF